MLYNLNTYGKKKKLKLKQPKIEGTGDVHQRNLIAGQDRGRE